jgi:hypothetical protein
MDYKIIKEVLLVSKKPTGKTKHLIGNEPMSVPFKLQVVQYENDTGFTYFI